LHIKEKPGRALSVMSFRVAIPSGAVPEGVAVGAEIDGEQIAICRSDGDLYAVQNRCPHAQSRLDGGRVRGASIACPLHGARFHLATGECVNHGLGYAPLRTFAVREVAGMIEVDISG
jgi:3-phenylpropionate/trans-cinnamate dioxygenase ferredoxin subunit